MENESYDCVVGMGCGDTCPAIPGAKKFEWDIPDPKLLNNEEFDKVRDLIKKKIPLNRFSTTKQIADIVFFLTTDKSASITGSSILSDGGWTAGK